MSALLKLVSEKETHVDSLNDSLLQKNLAELQDITISDSAFVQAFCTFVSMLTNAEQCILYKCSDDGVHVIMGSTSDAQYGKQKIDDIAMSILHSSQNTISVTNNESNRTARLSKFNVPGDSYILATETCNETPFAAALGQERFDLTSALIRQILVNRQQATHIDQEIAPLLMGTASLKKKTKNLATIFADKLSADLVAVSPSRNSIVQTKSLSVSQEVSQALSAQISIVMSEYIEDDSAGFYSETLTGDTIGKANLIKTLGGSTSIFRFTTENGVSCFLLVRNATKQVHEVELSSIAKGFEAIYKNSILNRLKNTIGHLPMMGTVPKPYQFPALVLLIFLLTVIPIPQTIKGKAFIVPTQQQVIAAPVAGRLQSVLVEPGDYINANQTLLATLDTIDLQTERDALKAKYASHLTEWRLNRADGDAANARLAKLRADEVAAQIKLTDFRIESSQIKSPMSGYVQGENQTKNTGATFSQGQELFRIVEKKSTRVELTVPVHDASKVDIKKKQISLRVDANPGKKYNLNNMELHPVAEFIDGENVLRAVGVIDAGSLRSTDKFLAGMQATYRIHVGFQPMIVHFLKNPVRRIRIFLGV